MVSGYPWATCAHVRTRRENELRIEVYDEDDDPLDDDPDFMGQVVLKGSGDEALPRSNMVSASRAPFLLL